MHDHRTDLEYVVESKTRRVEAVAAYCASCGWGGRFYIVDGEDPEVRLPAWLCTKTLLDAETSGLEDGAEHRDTMSAVSV